MPAYICAQALLVVFMSVVIAELTYLDWSDLAPADDEMLYHSMSCVGTLVRPEPPPVRVGLAVRLLDTVNGRGRKGGIGKDKRLIQS
jgi:hypothetical protein